MNDKILEKYNMPVPRYTSYPPANFFHPLSDDEYISAIVKSNNARNNNVSFYLHIPFCKHLCHYCGCNSYPMMKDGYVERYTDALHREIDLIAPYLNTSERRISQIHYGGGSPTVLPVGAIKELNEHLLSLMPATDNPEIAIECHPGYLTSDDWKALVESEFTRFSIGIQDFQERVLNAVNRRPSLIPVEEIVQILRAEGKKINMDLLFGLPYQTPDTFGETVLRAVGMRPDRIVTFSYGHVPWVHKRQMILERMGLPTDDVKQEMYQRAYGILHDAGYRSIGMDHFVLPDDDLSIALDTRRLHRNFQGYCTRLTTGQVYAFGVTGISQLDTAYAQNGKDIREYIDTVNAGKLYIERGYKLSDDEQITREVIETMMCNYRIEWNDIAECMSLTTERVKSALNYDAVRLQEMAGDGIIELTEDGISMTGEGSPFVRNVVASLDKLMINTERKFSKPI